MVGSCGQACEILEIWVKLLASAQVQDILGLRQKTPLANVGFLTTATFPSRRGPRPVDDTGRATSVTGAIDSVGQAEQFFRSRPWVAIRRVTECSMIVREGDAFE